MLPGDLPLDATRGTARTPLPAFAADLHWVNQNAAVDPAALRGRVLALVFWNEASVSSRNLLRELRQVRQKYPGAFTVLAVHTPRYTAQQNDWVVLQAARRDQLQAPVANDRNWQAWHACAIHAWPTTVLVDGAGGIAARFVGEGRGAEIEEAILQLQEGLVPAATGAPPELADTAPHERGGALAFPTFAQATATRLFVSDTRHHRVLECNLEGHVLRQFGSGTPGSWDGQWAACAFDAPEGMAVDAAGVLYVADPGAHCVRRIRPDTGDVDCVLGVGRPGYGAVDAQEPSLRVAVNAPRAVAVRGDALYVAAAGQNQILRVDLARERVAVVAGDGRSEVRDGIGGEASLAQPAGLAVLPGQLLIADSGGNAIRRLRLADLTLSTLAGASPWQPGRTDGTGSAVRFAWPGSLAVAGSRVYVADTGNDRLCVMDPYSGDVATLALDQPLHAPQGLSFGAGALWVACRDDHAVLRIDPATGACERMPIDE